MWYFLPLLIGYGILGWFAWSGNWNATFKKFILVYVSIPIAILIDVTFDWYVWSNDRNLFPIEIVMIFIVCQAPLLLGAFTRKKFGNTHCCPINEKKGFNPNGGRGKRGRIEPPPV